MNSLIRDRWAQTTATRFPAVSTRPGIMIAEAFDNLISIGSLSIVSAKATAATKNPERESSRN